MIKIREINIISESIKKSIGSTIRYLAGFSFVNKTERGYVFSDTSLLDFQTKMKEIKAAISGKIEYPELEQQDNISDDYIKEKFRKLADLYVEIYNMAYNNLENLKIPVGEDNTFREALNNIYSNDFNVPKSPNGDVAYVNRDMLLDILDKGKKLNGTPFTPVTQDSNVLIDGKIQIDRKCAGNNNDCVKKTEGTIGEIIGNFLWNNTVCLGKLFFKTVMFFILKPLLSLAYDIRLTNKSIGTNIKPLALFDIIKKYSFLLLLSGLPFIGPTIMAILIIILTNNFYSIIATYFCSTGKAIGQTQDETFKLVCSDPFLNTDIKYVKILPNNSGTDYIYKWIDPVGIIDGEWILYYENNIKHSGTITVIKTLQYNPYEKIPQYTIDSLYDMSKSDPELRPQSERAYIIDTQEDGSPIFIDISSGNESQACAQSTSLASYLLLMKLADVIMNPTKYGLDDPVSLVSIEMLKDDLNMMETMGILLQENETLDKIYSGIRASEQTASKLINQIKELQTKTSAQLAMNDPLYKYMKEKLDKTSPSSLMNPLLNYAIDSYLEIYSSLKQTLQPETLFEIACCLVGEAINETLRKTRSVEIDFDDINKLIKEYERTIDVWIKMIEMLIRLIGSDYVKIILSLLQKGADFVVQLAASLILDLYRAISSIIERFAEKYLQKTFSGSFLNCLPYTIILDAIVKLIKLLLLEFLKYLNMIIGKFKISLNKSYDITNRLAYLKILYLLRNILFKLKFSLSEFRRCIAFVPKGEPDEDNNIIRNIETPTVDTTFDPTQEFKDITSGKQPSFINEEQEPLSQVNGKLVALKASLAGKYLVTIDKRKFAYYLEKIFGGDPIAIRDFINGKKEYETFEDRACSNNNINLIYEQIKNYYNNM